ncbi:MAG: site-specific DNA-methyltransferase [Acidobacteria bacterium]|nr:site-specific DNA-methyltransferase [Acidobacteriota bacterium]MCI0721907.1 site-specific DNA-methyltransferase [Acidobacteriota bacterium]
MTILSSKPHGASVSEIEEQVHGLIGGAASSSIRSYLRLNSDSLFRREDRGIYALREAANGEYSRETRETIGSRSYTFGRASLLEADCFHWLRERRKNSIHAVVTDPPYGLVEYTSEEQEKLRKGRGGIWRIPPTLDGAKRSPVPRFTVLSPDDLEELAQFFFEWGCALLPALVPGANVVVASNPLLSYLVSGALARAGLERRGEIVRLVMTMRGGDRPKAAHEEFFGVSVMPRSMWEPWLLFRKPIEGRVQDNLRKWKTGGFRRPSGNRPFGDVIPSAPTHKSERTLAPHPSLKPQTFLRTLIRGVLPLGEGVVLDTFAGSGSTLAAAEALGYESVGIEKDSRYFDLASNAIPKLAGFKNGLNYSFNL